MENITKTNTTEEKTDDYELNINFIPINSSNNEESLIGNTTITQINIEKLDLNNDTKILENKKGIIYQLCMLKGFDELTEILKLMANSRSLSFLSKEFKDGITCLRDAKMLYELYEVLEINFKSHKSMDENFLISSILLFSYEYQERLIILILEKNIKFQPFFYSKLIDALVKEDQILSAANIFFLFNFNFSENLFPNMNLLIEKLISNNLFSRFYAKFRDTYLLNDKIFQANIDYLNIQSKAVKTNYDTHQVVIYDKLNNNFEDNENLNTNFYNNYNQDFEYSYYSKDDQININNIEFTKEVVISNVDDEEINLILESISLKVQKNLRLEKKTSSKELKEILLEREKSFDLIPSEESSDNHNNNIVFLKNKVLEEMTCNSILQEVSKKM